MTVSWAVQMAGDFDDLPLQQVAGEIVNRFNEGAATAAEVGELRQFADALRGGAPMSTLEPTLRRLSHAGYLRGALVAMASALIKHPRADVALSLARELCDALDPALGLQIARAMLTLPEVETTRRERGAPFAAANHLLGEHLLQHDEPQAARRHFEAALAVDIDDRRALRGWSEASKALERRGLLDEHRSRGLALLDGLDELELSHGFGIERYELGRPLGRGRHAVVYQAFDRHVGRDVAIKRLLDPSARQSSVPHRVLEARFFSEARTLARVRSPFVVALLDVRPRHRFICIELCRGGNLRLATRRGLVGPDDLERIGRQLRAAVASVHAAGAVHRDIKPANILVRASKHDSPIALADFGLAVGADPKTVTARAGTLRYLAPELRAGQKATVASDWFSAGVVLLELALAPRTLPEVFDRVGDDLDAASHVPLGLPGSWTPRLQQLLSSDPKERLW